MRRPAALVAAVLAAAILTGPSFDAPRDRTVEATASSPARPFVDLEDRLGTSTTSTSSTTTTTSPPPPPTSSTTTTTAPPAPAPPSSSPGPCGGLESALSAHFPPSEIPNACHVIRCETGGTFDPRIRNSSSSASGLFQFLDSTWKSTTGTAPPASAYTVDEQIAAGASLWRSSGWGPWSCRP